MIALFALFVHCVLQSFYLLLSLRNKQPPRVDIKFDVFVFDLNSGNILLVKFNASENVRSHYQVNPNGRRLNHVSDRIIHFDHNTGRTDDLFRYSSFILCHQRRASA